MSNHRALTHEQAVEAERWFAEYEAIGTVIAKCRELGIDKVTFYDTIARVRGKDTRTIRAKLSGLATTFHVEPKNQPQPTVEEHKATPNND